MKKHFQLLLALTFSTITLQAQNIGEDHVIISTGIDVYSTNNYPISVARNLRSDLDFNYFVTDHLTLGIGVEYNNYLSNSTHVSPGLRLYASDAVFFRAKSYVSSNFNYVDGSLGIGADIFATDYLAFEVTGDYLLRYNIGVARFGIALFL